ncbi:Ultraviolet-B receptor UVR8 [Capsicum annuum]|nr:Ultraviolet-B receptor UVR8 [Capsicum annuum]
MKVFCSNFTIIGGWCRTKGDFGRLGHGNSSDLFTPQPIKALHGTRIKQIACGDSHCLAVTMEGEVQSWGRNQNGQLGLGTTEDSLVPRKIEAFKEIPVKMVAAGAEHTAAVSEDGELYGWGWGRYGNLGLGDRNDRLVPEKVSANVVGISCGMFLLITVRLFLITATI